MSHSRSIWKNFIFNSKVLTNIKKNKNTKHPILINNKSDIITPICKNLNFKISNGYSFTKLNIKENMIGHKFGEFIFTRKRNRYKKKHGSKNKS
jgi:small subunit ribosomal protein S19